MKILFTKSNFNSHNKVLSYTAGNELVEYVVTAGFKGKQYEQFQKFMDTLMDNMSINREEAEMGL